MRKRVLQQNITDGFNVIHFNIMLLKEKEN